MATCRILYSAETGMFMAVGKGIRICIDSGKLVNGMPYIRLLDADRETLPLIDQARILEAYPEIMEFVDGKRKQDQRTWPDYKAISYV